MNKIQQTISDEIARIKQLILETTQQIEKFRNEGDEDNIGISADLQGKLEILQNKIQRLQKSLQAQAYEARDTSKRIDIGSTAIISNGSTEKKVTLVLANDANSQNDLISTESPLGKALLNREKGDDISIKTPSGSIKFQVLSVS
jgi:transcription elongation factor GreA